MSDSSFLQAEWPAVFEAAGRAEGAAHADPPRPLSCGVE